MNSQDIGLDRTWGLWRHVTGREVSDISTDLSASISGWNSLLLLLFLHTTLRPSETSGTGVIYHRTWKFQQHRCENLKSFVSCYVAMWGPAAVFCTWYLTLYVGWVTNANFKCDGDEHVCMWLTFRTGPLASRLLPSLGRISCALPGSGQAICLLLQTVMACDGW